MYFIVLSRIHKATNKNRYESTMLRGIRREGQSKVIATVLRIHTNVLLSVKPKKEVFPFYPKDKIQDMQKKRKETNVNALYSFLSSGEIGQAFIQN